MMKLCCIVNPWIGCNACGWQMCEPCRRRTRIYNVNRAIHKEDSPTCKEGDGEVEGNEFRWPSFYVIENQ